jgi:hypothetical protein
VTIGRLLALLVLLAGCGSEGGVTGTGINSSISGSIVQISDVPPVAIRITVAEAPAVTTVAAGDGTFALRGPFAGAVTLLFSDDASGAEIGPLALEIPAGSVTLLENVAIDLSAPPPARVQPLAVRQLDIVAHVDLAECARATLLVSDGAGRQFLVALTEDTEIVARDGSARDCADLGVGRRVGVEGFLRLRDRTLVATRVVVAPSRPAPPDEPRRERFRGLALAVDCGLGEIVLSQRLDGEPVRRRLLLAANSEVRCGAAGRACGCEDIAVGSGLTGSGTIFPRRPGMVIVDEVLVTPPARRPSSAP